MNFKELGENLGLDEDEYRELVELFVDTGSAEFERLKTGIAANDKDTMVRSAHTIKGAAGNLGLMEIHEEAKKIEHLISQGRTDDLDQAMQILEKMIQGIGAFVKGT
jgi:HPt (histidine-containing phosphotransfer) domain-containing protein